ncbi:hypothetical protein GCM10022226_38590 [Sphaerisporangium flaviroseum]|uniref:Uncharacterized protein n=1 Tax=Sphaerisporangium flaviroseum TaxID=509199 RepID=A0ABP7IBC6_9ACTN
MGEPGAARFVTAETVAVREVVAEAGDTAASGDADRTTARIEAARGPDLREGDLFAGRGGSGQTTGASTGRVSRVLPGSYSEAPIYAMPY